MNLEKDLQKLFLKLLKNMAEHLLPWKVIHQRNLILKRMLKT